jgi:hypothetical protein
MFNSAEKYSSVLRLMILYSGGLAAEARDPSAVRVNCGLGLFLAITFLGTFAYSPKAPVSFVTPVRPSVRPSVRVSVRLSAWISASPTGRISVKMAIGDLQKSVGNSRFC